MSRAPSAGDTCVVLAAKLEVYRDSPPSRAEQQLERLYVSQGDTFEVTRSGVSPLSTARTAVWFQLVDGNQVWTYWNDGGPPVLEAVRDVAEMRQLVTKILAAAQVQRWDRLPLAAAGGTPGVGGHGSADEGASLARQLSAHGPEYDALLEQGVPRSHLRKAWVMGGPNREAAMAFLRANAD